MIRKEKIALRTNRLDWENSKQQFLLTMRKCIGISIEVFIEPKYILQYCLFISNQVNPISIRMLTLQILHRVYCYSPFRTLQLSKFIFGQSTAAIAHQLTAILQFTCIPTKCATTRIKIAYSGWTWSISWSSFFSHIAHMARIKEHQRGKTGYQKSMANHKIQFYGAKFSFEWETAFSSFCFFHSTTKTTINVLERGVSERSRLREWPKGRVEGSAREATKTGHENFYLIVCAVHLHYIRSTLSLSNGRSIGHLNVFPAWRTFHSVISCAGNSLHVCEVLLVVILDIGSLSVAAAEVDALNLHA